MKRTANCKPIIERNRKRIASWAATSVLSIATKELKKQVLNPKAARHIKASVVHFYDVQ